MLIFYLFALFVQVTGLGGLKSERGNRCASRSGRCQDDSNSCYGGSYLTGLCPGPKNIRCCAPNASKVGIKCTGLNGRCQYDSHTCYQGSYVSNLCPGPKSFRCCVPQPSIMNRTCSTTQKNLACQVLHSPNVRLARIHVSGEKDNAYADNNIKDVCEGGQAARSNYNCKDYNCYAPGGSTCLSDNLLRFLVDLNSLPVKLLVKELAGDCHSCTSRHYSGLAVDLHKPSSSQIQNQLKSLCVKHKGSSIVERYLIQCQFTDGQHPNWNN